MAISPAHRFGQIIGELLEDAVRTVLIPFAKNKGLYLDQIGKRPCRNGTKKCTWTDLNGNKHDLDFVLERGGTPQKLGTPVAFIETAWRRYTKHSKNKAQEIQGAILPLAATYGNAGPFTGAVLGGVFTSSALTQLRSLGFQIVYISYENIIAVLNTYGIDAEYDQDTPDAEFTKKINRFEALTSAQRRNLVNELLSFHKSDVATFMKSLESAVSRQIVRIIILPLHGIKTELKTVPDAIAFIQKYDEFRCSARVDRYEIQVRYNNGNEIEGRFNDKQSALDFLRAYHPIA